LSCAVCVTDYVGFIKKVMKQLQNPYYVLIQRTDVDLRQLDDSELTAAPGDHSLPRPLLGRGTVSTFVCPSCLYLNTHGHTQIHTHLLTSSITGKFMGGFFVKLGETWLIVGHRIIGDRN